MKHISLITICFLTLISGVSYAQELTNKEMRKVNSMVLDIVERYEDFAAMYDEDSEYEFLRLFKNKEVPVYAGDLMLGFAVDSASLSVADYARYVLDYAENVAISISEVKKGTPVISGEHIYIPVSLKKSIEYMDGTIMISSEGFYAQDFNLQLTMICDRDLRTCRINSITGSIDSEEVFPMKYWVVMKPEETFSKLDLNRLITADGQPLQYNDFGYALVKENSIDENLDLKYEIRLQTDTLGGTTRHKVLSYDFKKTRGRLKIRNKLAPMSAYEFTGALNKRNMDSWAYELGVDLGFGVPMGANGRSRFGMFIGAAASLSSINLSHDPISYEYTLTSTRSTSNSTNVVNTQYDFSINGVTEGIKYLDLMVPLYMSFDHCFDRNGRVWLSWNFGAKAYLNTNQKIALEIFTPIYHANGSYKINDRNENIDKNFTAFLAPASYERNLIDISAAANAALNIRCTNSLFVTVGAGYEYGLTDTYSSDEKVFTNNKDRLPFIYSIEEGDVVAAYSMINSVSFKRKALWIDLGLMFKF